MTLPCQGAARKGGLNALIRDTRERWWLANPGTPSGSNSLRGLSVPSVQLQPHRPTWEGDLSTLQALQGVEAWHRTPKTWGRDACCPCACGAVQVRRGLGSGRPEQATGRARSQKQDHTLNSKPQPPQMPMFHEGRAQRSPDCLARGGPGRLGGTASKKACLDAMVAAKPGKATRGLTGAPVELGPQVILGVGAPVLEPTRVVRDRPSLPQAG